MPTKLVAILLLVVLLAGCASSSRSSAAEPTEDRSHPPLPAGPVAAAGATVASGVASAATAAVGALARAVSGLPAFSHVFIIVLENREASQVEGSNSAPYLNSLAAQYARASNYYAIRHPSLPNYLALAGGDTFGITNDCTTCTVAADNIARQLESAGRSWKAYMESMPKPCFQGASSSRYAKKHNPFMYFDNVRTDPALCSRIVPLTELSADLQGNHVPDFVWITPDLCSDGHDCPTSTVDAWLKAWVPQILASSAWKDHGVLFITFDEGRSNAGCCQYATGGRVDTLVISPLVRPGFVSQTAYNHYSLLRTVEEAWGLPLLGKAGCDCTPAMTDFFGKP